MPLMPAIVARRLHTEGQSIGENDPMRMWLPILLIAGAVAPAPISAEPVGTSNCDTAKVKMQILKDGESRYVSVDLHYEQDRLAIYEKNSGHKEPLKTLRYARMVGAEYSAKGANLPGLGFVTRGRKHSMTIRFDQGSTLLRLHRGDHEEARRQFTGHTGLNVQEAPTVNIPFHWPAAL